MFYNRAVIVTREGGRFFADRKIGNPRSSDVKYCLAEMDLNRRGKKNERTEVGRSENYHSKYFKQIDKRNDQVFRGS